MSGHSHFKSIKHQKEAADVKRGKEFSKLSRLITVAVKEKGADPAANSALRLAMEKAKEINMPKDNVEKSIKRGTGELAGENLEEVIFEAFGPGGVAIIIEGITDNKNRILGEIKQVLSRSNGKLANEGSVRWLFEKKGVIMINAKNQSVKKEEIELAVIDAGAEDIYWHEDLLDVYTKPENLENIKKNLEQKQIKAESSSLDFVPKEMIEVSEKDKESCQKLFEALYENDAVQDIYSNLRV